jgi:hypothetical protein
MMQPVRPWLAAVPEHVVKQQHGSLLGHEVLQHQHRK